MGKKGRDDLRKQRSRGNDREMKVDGCECWTNAIDRVEKPSWREDKGTVAGRNSPIVRNGELLAALKIYYDYCICTFWRRGEGVCECLDV